MNLSSIVLTQVIFGVLFKAGANQSNISSKITFLPCWMKSWNGLRNCKIYKVSKKKKNHVGWCWMKFVPQQNLIHVLRQKYELCMLDWFGEVFHPFINFRWFQTFARLNCNSNFLMCFRILNFVSVTNIYCGWGRHKTILCNMNNLYLTKRYSS